MPKTSAGIIFFRFRFNQPEVLLVHPGGPFWVKKDAGAWSIPKGEIEAGEEPLQAATREVKEETGWDAQGTFIPLTPVQQKSGKIIKAWAVQQDHDPAGMVSNSFEMEWPPHSGKKKNFPEADRASWFTMEEARIKIIPGQVPLLNELEKMLGL
ncbi:NUDIX domain-containing protein [Flavihumibacter solisilvae]|uniref:NUDIX hydrolase n=1 Tax=Flavihumibacter solisilvae TaxID=1349421 RepID=A0A0C1IEY3_9BACT|nr:NUDIX domain-containing protein [Flavihumibacter solisilvae]KIC92735.1 NUDIX hydrolase [Flavihumibacter solisilvae]